MKLSSVLLPLCALALAGCGGSGGSDPVAPPTRVETATALNERWKDVDATATMPKSGTATYSGTALIGNDVSMDALLADHRLTADANLTASFSTTATTVSGGFDNFQTASGDAVAGAITLDSDAAVMGSGLTAGLSGTIGADEVTGDLTGFFRGENADAVTGSFTGGNLAGGGDFQGAFIVER